MHFSWLYVCMATRKSSDSAANDLIPPRPTLTSLKNAAADCKACDLWLKGTQTVFGEGGRRARVMFIGEQPGNEEDLTGKPFIGPAGRLLDSALEEAGIDRKQTYVTKQRGEFIESTLAPYVMATVHPSSILRAPDDETRQLEYRQFVDDLKKLARVIN